MSGKDGLQDLRIESGVGCSDGSCVFGHPGGLQTNGGCHCLSDLPFRQRIGVTKFLRGLRKMYAAEIKKGG